MKPLRAFAIIVFASLVSACATQPAKPALPALVGAPEANQAARATALAAFPGWSMTGRIAVTNGQQGGSGRSFDWHRLPQATSKPILLAGGLRAANVAAAIRTARPWGVDVSSGIEVGPGIKDGALMRRFVEEVRRADCIELGEDGNVGECHACGR